MSVGSYIKKMDFNSDTIVNKLNRHYFNIFTLFSLMAIRNEEAGLDRSMGAMHYYW